MTESNPMDSSLELKELIKGLGGKLDNQNAIAAKHQAETNERIEGLARRQTENHGEAKRNFQDLNDMQQKWKEQIPEMIRAEVEANWKRMTKMESEDKDQDIDQITKDNERTSSDREETAGGVGGGGRNQYIFFFLTQYIYIFISLYLNILT